MIHTRLGEQQLAGIAQAQAVALNAPAMTPPRRRQPWSMPTRSCVPRPLATRRCRRWRRARLRPLPRRVRRPMRSRKRPPRNAVSPIGSLGIYAVKHIANLNDRRADSDRYETPCHEPAWQALANLLARVRPEAHTARNRRHHGLDRFAGRVRGPWRQSAGQADATPPRAAQTESTEDSTAATSRAPWDPPGPAADDRIMLCQALSPADPNPIPGVDCTRSPGGCGVGWGKLGPVSGFQEYAQGEYVGRARLPHVPNYRLHIDDILDFVFPSRATRFPRPTRSTWATS